MKIAALLLAALCGSALAQNMARMGDTSDGTWYFIESTAHGNVAKTWMLLERRVPLGGAQSEKVLYEIECRERLVRATVYSYSQPRGAGAVVSTNATREWAPIVPGSTPHGLLSLVCR